VKRTKPVFGVDVDDTLIHCAAAMCAYLNRVHGYTIEKSDMTTFYFGDLLGLSRQEARAMIYPFHFSKEHENISPISGAHEALSTLSLRYTPIAITARSPTTRIPTVTLVERHFPGIFKEVLFTGYVPGQPYRSKGDVCADLGVAFMVEDALHNAVSVGERGITVYLLDTPWNQGALPPNTIRVACWDDIVRHVTDGALCRK